MVDNYVDSKEIAAMDFGDGKAVDGMTPEGGGAGQAPVGKHVMDIVAVACTPQPVQVTYTDSDTKQKTQHILYKIKIGWRVAVGEEDAGTAISNFGYLPSARGQVPGLWANELGKLLKALGFELTEGMQLPANFAVNQLIGRRAIVEVQLKFKADKTEDINPRTGLQWNKVKFFGFEPIDGPQPAPPVAGDAPADSYDL